MSNQPNPNQQAANEHETAPDQQPLSPRKTLIGVALIFIVLACLAGFGILRRKSADKVLADTTQQLAAPTVIVAPPKPGAPVDNFVLPGNVTSFTDSPIYARTSGYLTKWYFDIGARVKKGALLAEIATPEVDQQLAQAEADLSTAQANANNAHIQADRYTGLVQSNAVSRQDTDTFVNQAASTAAQVRSAQANVQRLRELQSFEKIYAPFDGVVTARNVDTGQLIDPGAGKELFHLQAIQTLRVFTNLPQLYSSNVRPGTKIGLTFPEHAGKIYEGTLVRTAEAIDPASRTLLVEIDVNNSAGELLPGSLAEVHFKTPPAGPTFIVPAAALIFRKEGLRVGTVVQGEGGSGTVAHLVQVVIGQDDGASVQIISGLGPSDQVIQDPPDSLIEGEKLQVVTPAPSGRQVTMLAPRAADRVLEPANSPTRHRREAAANLPQTQTGCPTLAASLFLRLGWVIIPAAFLTACKPVGPNYNRPVYQAPPAYKETGASSVVPPPNPAGGAWQPANPSDGMLRGKWWEIYQDPQLNQLEERIATDNQTLRQAMENYLAARDQVTAARSTLFPTLSADATATRLHTSKNGPSYSSAKPTGYGDLVIGGQASWEPDLWGRIRRTVEAARSNAQATAADQANIGLSLHAEMAADYFQLRGLDAETKLLNATVADLENQLGLTQRRLQGGVATEADVAQAQTELETVRAQLVDIGVARAQFEHAIGTIANLSLSSFSIPPSPLDHPVAQGPSRRPFATPRAPSGHLRRRAPRRGCQRPDRHRCQRLLSHHFVERHRRLREHARRHMDSGSKRDVEFRRAGRGASLRRRPAPRPHRRGPPQLRSPGRGLSQPGPSGLQRSRRPALRPQNSRTGIRRRAACRRLRAALFRSIESALQRRRDKLSRSPHRRASAPPKPAHRHRPSNPPIRSQRRLSPLPRRRLGYKPIAEIAVNGEKRTCTAKASSKAKRCVKTRFHGSRQMLHDIGARHLRLLKTHG